MNIRGSGEISVAIQLLLAFLCGAAASNPCLLLLNSLTLAADLQKLQWFRLGSLHIGAGKGLSS